VIALVGAAASRGDDPPKDQPKESSPKERYAALVKEYQAKQSELIAEFRKTKDDEQRKVLEKYNGLGKEFAEKFYQVAEDDPKGQAGADALFWIIQNAAGGDTGKKAAEKVVALVGEMPASDLNKRLQRMRAGNPAVLDAVLKRAEKEGTTPFAGDFYAWVATNGFTNKAGKTAISQLVEKFPDHSSIDRLCAMLASNSRPEAGETLKQILERAPSRRSRRPPPWPWASRSPAGRTAWRTSRPSLTRSPPRRRPI